MAARVSETDSFHKFCFAKNFANNTADKGIENLYSAELFTPDLYDRKITPTGYGGSKEELTFSKFRFGEKVKSLTEVEVFANFKPLVDKIRNLLDTLPHVPEATNGI
jgi:hypothetical protein